MTPTVRVFSDYENLSRAAAEGFVDCCSKSVAERDSFNIALSGGETPQRLYEVLASEYIDRVPWNKVNLFWSDERYVSQRDRRSNFRMFHEKLLYDINIPLENIHPMPTHRESAVDAANDYELYMRSVFAGRWPDIDVILLGMGADGHTASIFSGSPALDDTDKWVMAVEAPLEPSTRLTFTLPVLNAATDVCFVVSGENKADAVNRVLTEAVGSQSLPAARVRPDKGQLVWWVDEAAFSKVDEAAVNGFDIVHVG